MAGHLDIGMPQHLGYTLYRDTIGHGPRMRKSSADWGTCHVEPENTAYHKAGRWAWRQNEWRKPDLPKKIRTLNGDCRSVKWTEKYPKFAAKSRFSRKDKGMASTRNKSDLLAIPLSVKGRRKLYHSSSSKERFFTCLLITLQLMESFRLLISTID